MKPDCGPAFPTNSEKTRFSPAGMTLRDYFAAAALKGWWAQEDAALPGKTVYDDFMAERCRTFYKWADAMLKARDA